LALIASPRYRYCPPQSSIVRPMNSMTDKPTAQAVRVWDLPTRLFHWLLALTVIASVLTGQFGGNAMVWHLRLGLLVLALLAFRLIWGFTGGHWSRFSSFTYGPSSLVAQLRGLSGPGGCYQIGHSPLGALSVWALLGLLAVQVATGLVADDEVATNGPLNRFVSGAVAGAASAWHKHVGKPLLIVLMLLHLAAVLYYLWRGRRNLIAPMIHGDKTLPAGTPASADGGRRRLQALAAFAIALALAWWVGSLDTP
jgi:cytochrome b